MIKVEIYQEDKMIDKVSVSGHAEYDQSGKDLVCAAVSSVMTGLLNSFDQLMELGYKLVYQEDPALIEIQAVHPTDRGQIMLEVGIIQLKTIAEEFPQYIQINYRR